MAKKFYTTRQAAARIRVSPQTLYNWMKAGIVKAPEAIAAGGASIRLWTEADIAAARKLRGTVKVGRPRTKSKR